MNQVRERIKIVSADDVMGGDPCVEGTRLPAETIILNLKAGHPLETIFAAYPSLPPGGVEAAICWAEESGINWRR